MSIVVVVLIPVVISRMREGVWFFGIVESRFWPVLGTSLRGDVGKGEGGIVLAAHDDVRDWDWVEERVWFLKKWINYSLVGGVFLISVEYRATNPCT